MQKFITTYVDNINVKEVNLWSHITKRDKIVAVCQDDDLVTVLQVDGDYSKVRTSDGKEGWCISGFLI